MLDNIARVPMLTEEEFRARHLSRAEPVVFTEIFRDQPLRDLSSESTMRRAIGKSPIDVVFNYAEAELLAFHGKKPPEPPLRNPTIDDYLTYVEREPNTRFMSIEMPIPPALRAQFTVPSLCMQPGGDDLVCFFFLGNQGNYASMHFDADQRHVLLYQVYGRKRVILARPSASRKVAPVAHFATQRISSFSEDDKTAFATYLGAYDFMLNPGEAVYIPPLFWHYLDYVDNAMSFNLRFGRNRYNRALSGDLLHPNWRLQRIASEFFDADRVETNPTLKAAFQAIASEAAKAHPTPAARHEALERLFVRIHAELFPDEVAPHCIDGLDEIRRSAGVGFYASRPPSS